MSKANDDAKNSEICKAIAKLVVNSGYYDFCQSTQSDISAVQNDGLNRNGISTESEPLLKIVDFINVCSNFYSLTELLDFISVNSSASFISGEQNVVSIMTIHSAKGLEFDNLFLPGWENGIIPSIRSIDNGIDEERRLAYVAITRARDKLFITYAHNRQIEGFWRNADRSVFIDMLMNNSVEFKDFFTNVSQSNVSQINIVGVKNDEIYRKKIQANSSSYKDSNEIRIGSIVSHGKFGVGVVSSLSDDIAQVRFSSGVRNIMVSFLKSNE
jgi:DNA helicase-2/ATP-dependent DNA helicase PcrA